MHPQPAIFADLPPAARFLSFDLAHGARAALAGPLLAGLEVSEDLLVGLGPPLVALLGAHIPGLRPFPALAGPGVTCPSTQDALLVRVGGPDRGAVLHAARAMAAGLAPAFTLRESTDTFVFDGGRDLSGYMDGTENPQGPDAADAALIAHGPLAGSSFVVVQRWVHDLDALARHDGPTQDRMIGRTRADDVELDDAPPDAHVRRTAAESFSPPARLWRRSMPWADGTRSGLVFVAFARDLGTFEAPLRRMLGLEDGVTDALFRFTRPETGASYWVPPAHGRRLNLSALAT